MAFVITYVKKKCILLFFMKKKYILKYISKVTFKNILQKKKFIGNKKILTIYIITILDLKMNVSIH